MRCSVSTSRASSSQRGLGGGVGGLQLHVGGLQLLGQHLRLGHLLLQLGGRFSCAASPAGVRLGGAARLLQPRQQRVAVGLGLAPLVDVVKGAGPLADGAVPVQHGDAARRDPAVLAAGHPQPVLGVVGAARVVRLVQARRCRSRSSGWTASVHPAPRSSSRVWPVRRRQPGMSSISPSGSAAHTITASDSTSARSRASLRSTSAMGTVGARLPAWGSVWLICGGTGERKAPPAAGG